MKIKKALCILLASIMFVSVFTSTFYSYADIADKDEKENLAWLSDFYIRESSTDFTKNNMVPISEKYSHKLDDFRKEVEEIKKMYKIDFETLKKTYLKIFDEILKIIDEANIELPYDDMKAYLIDEWKIVFPEVENADTITYTTIAYGCLKYDLLFPITNTHFTVEPGTTLERTIVLIASVLLNEEIDESIQTFDDYVILQIKKSLINNGYPVSDNADEEEIMILYKIMMAEQQGYIIENQNVAEYTEQDKKYVDGAYMASIIKSRFEITATVEATIIACESEDVDSLAIHILQTMIIEKNETVEDNEPIEQLFSRACILGYFELDKELYSDVYKYEVYLTYNCKEIWVTPEDNEPIEQLFSRACILGYFELDKELYSDVYKYEVYLTYNCKEIWVTPFAYAAEKGSDKINFVDIDINGEKIRNGRSHRLKLAGDISYISVKLKYDDGVTKDSAEYKFKVFNGNKELTDTSFPTPFPPYKDDEVFDFSKYNKQKPKYETTNIDNFLKRKQVPLDLYEDTNAAGVFSPVLDNEQDVVKVNTNSVDTKNENKKLSKKQVAGISVSAVAVLAGTAAVIILVLKRKKQNK